MTIWLCSDWHLAHENIYKFTYTDADGAVRRVRERFKDAQEGDDYMMQRWNELVKPEDHVWHLGDVTMERSSNAKQWFVNKIHSLPGHKRLILGNHDHLAMDVYRDAGFQKIKGSHKIDNLLLSHYPLHESTIPLWASVNCHGHIHQNPAPSLRHMNLCVEVTNYEPVPLDTVLEAAKQQRILWDASRPSISATQQEEALRVSRIDVNGAMMDRGD